MNKELLRHIPKIDDILGLSAIASSGLSQKLLLEAARGFADELRRGILAGEVDTLPTEEEVCASVIASARAMARPSLRPVINGTGVILHTNLGRARLSERAAAAAYEAARNYSTLEYDLATGGRGLRYSHVESLITGLTGAESALVVNNNAAAVLLVLTAMASGGEVITSRGELVEIGGSFRVPDIMESCGCRLREVGTTNKTKISDYERAIGPETRALMKVHTSNFKIVGFTEKIELADMVNLAHERDLPVIEDLGSGSLTDLRAFGIHDEPTVQQSVQAGVDVITFSGDKLLGGPQAGIIIGRKKYIDMFKKHPLTRAMRVDKMTLAALEATLRAYEDGTASSTVPTISMLDMSEEDLLKKAEKLLEAVKAAGIAAEIIPEHTQVGGGSVPTQLLPAFVVGIRPTSISVNQLEARLRKTEVPVVGRISKDIFMLDARTIEERDFAVTAASLAEALK